MTRQPEPLPARVPDDQLHYDENLIYTYRGERFTGVGYEDVPGRGLEEISYVDGLQEGPARDWYPSGQLRGETMFRANGRMVPVASIGRMARLSQKHFMNTRYACARERSRRMAPS
jgi:hypothetical protein